MLHHSVLSQYSTRRVTEQCGTKPDANVSKPGQSPLPVHLRAQGHMISLATANSINPSTSVRPIVIITRKNASLGGLPATAS